MKKRGPPPPPPTRRGPPPPPLPRMAPSDTTTPQQQQLPQNQLEQQQQRPEYAQPIPQGLIPPPPTPVQTNPPTQPLPSQTIPGTTTEETQPNMNEQQPLTQNIVSQQQQHIQMMPPARTGKPPPPVPGAPTKNRAPPGYKGGKPPTRPPPRTVMPETEPDKVQQQTEEVTQQQTVEQKIQHVPASYIEQPTSQPLQTPTFTNEPQAPPPPLVLEQSAPKARNTPPLPSKPTKAKVPPPVSQSRAPPQPPKHSQLPTTTPTKPHQAPQSVLSEPENPISEPSNASNSKLLQKLQRLRQAKQAMQEEQDEAQEEEEIEQEEYEYNENGVGFQNNEERTEEIIYTEAEPVITPVQEKVPQNQQIFEPTKPQKAPQLHIQSAVKQKISRVPPPNAGRKNPIPPAAGNRNIPKVPPKIQAPLPPQPTVEQVQTELPPQQETVQPQVTFEPVSQASAPVQFQQSPAQTQTHHPPPPVSSKYPSINIPVQQSSQKPFLSQINSLLERYHTLKSIYLSNIHDLQEQINFHKQEEEKEVQKINHIIGELGKKNEKIRAMCAATTSINTAFNAKQTQAAV